MIPGRLRADEGFTLVEMLVTLGIFSGVLALLATALSSGHIGLERQIARVDSNDQVRLVAQSIDREVRSGDLLYVPDLEAYPPGDIACYTPNPPSGLCTAGFAMRLLSQANAPTRGGKRCVQYRITSTGQLQRRDWTPAWTDSSNESQVSSWRVLATGIRNRAEGVAAFTRPYSNLLQINLLANARPGPGPVSGPTVTRIRLSVSGRNSTLVSDLDQCGPSPPDPALTGVGGSRVPPY